MTKNVIVVENLTKNYGNGRGIFDVSFEVKEGEIFGFVGTNGSGKTTTIRNIMGFIRPDNGRVLVKDMDSWKDSYEIKRFIGYVPGEIAFPDLQTGREFLHLQAEMLNLKNIDYANTLIKKLQLDASARLKTMSKGTKQKTAIVHALMGDPEILILDEPTTGLDPLMRVTFVDIIKEEKRRGKTIFMSSHIFEEMESTCDRIALIRDGRIVDIADMEKIRNHGIRTYKIAFTTPEEYEKFLTETSFGKKDLKPIYNQLLVDIRIDEINVLFDALKNYSVRFIAENKYTLEQYFAKKFNAAEGTESC